MLTKNNMIRLKSFTGDTWYNISLDRRTCDCPAFRMMPGPPCKHLNALGIYSERKPWRKSSVREANSWVPGVSPANDNRQTVSYWLINSHAHLRLEIALRQAVMNRKRRIETRIDVIGKLKIPIRTPPAQQNRQCCIIALASKARGVRRWQQALALFRSEPIANRHTQSLGTLHPANPGSQVCTEETTIGSLVSV